VLWLFAARVTESALRSVNTQRPYKKAQFSKGEKTMSEVEKHLSVKLSKNAELAGAQEMIDAQLANLVQRGFSLHIQYIDGPGGPGDPGPIRTQE
jgi:hypothetical protein